MVIGQPPRGPAETRAAVLDALRGVADPEIPNVSIVDLGMVGAIDLPEAWDADGSIRIELLPTFVGCPAVDVIRREAEAAVERRTGSPAVVEVSFATSWTSDRITPLGRERLRLSGFAPPPLARAPEDVGESPRGAGEELAGPETTCPYCDSPDVALSSLFGPTQCRSLYYCRGCRQPFEAFKPV